MPEAAGGWTDCVLRCDRDRQWWYESLSGAADARLAGSEAALRRSGAGPRVPDRLGAPPTVRHIAPGCWPAWRRSARARSTRRACAPSSPARSPATRWTSSSTASPAPRRPGRPTSPATGARSLRCHRSCSCARRGEVVTSSPIKGTLPLHARPSALRASSKDVAENIMIVDLVRNDLGRVAVTGTVTVPELLVVRPAPGVWHLVSTVSAQVPVELPTTALLDATFPPASVTGTPKLRARQLISQWEQSRRGVYCGTVGLASPVAGCELNVAIRTVEFDAAGNAVLGVRRRDHRRLRPRRRMGGVPAQGRPDHRGGRSLSPGPAAPRRRAHAVTAPRRRGNHLRAGVFDPHSVVDQRSLPRATRVRQVGAAAPRRPARR